MKKLILLLLLLAVVYGVLLVLFPARQPVQASLQYFGRAAISYRLLQQPAQWIKAVQGTMVQPDSSLLVTDFGFKLQGADMNQMQWTIAGKGQQLTAPLLLLDAGKDSTIATWAATVQAKNPWLPWSRIQALSIKNLLEADMMRVLVSFSQYSHETINSYGLNITPGQMTDSLLLTTSFESPEKPSQQLMYAKLAVMQQWTANAQAAPTNAPMLYVQGGANGQPYRCQLALPVNKTFKVPAGYSFKRMVLGNNLSAEVTGGPASIAQAFQAMYLYVAEHTLTMPAIPYEVMLTNRQQQPDTALWKTRVVFPVM